MKDLWSAQEIAEALDMSLRHVQRLARQGRWPFETRPTTGAWKKMFYFNELPNDIQRRLKEHDLVERLRVEDPELGPKLWVVQAVERAGGIRAFLRAWPDMEKPVDMAGLRVTRSTVSRWVKAYRAEGVEGLRDRRGRQGRLSQEAKDFIVGLIANQPHINATAVWQGVRLRWDVSERTVRRFIRAWKLENRELWAWLNNPDAWKNKYQVSYGDLSAKFFGQVWELDSTPMDVMTTDGRYSVIGLIDVYSRKVKLVVSKTSNSVGIAAVLRRALLDWGVPQVAVMDNGKDYVSRHIMAVMGRLGVEVPEVPPYTPERKPHIERFFGTLAVQFFERQPGFIGHNVAQRQEIRARTGFGERARKPAVKVSLSAGELQARMDRWVEEVYHRAPGRDGKSPNERAAASKVPIARIEDERALDVLLAPGERRRVQKYGIQWEGRLYHAPDLAQIVGRDVEIRIDLWDAGVLYVFYDGRYFCRAVDKERLGVDYKTFKDAKRAQKRRLREQAKALKGLAEDVDLTFAGARPESEAEHHRPPSIPLVNREVKEAIKAGQDAGAGNDRPYYLQDGYWDVVDEARQAEQAQADEAPEDAARPRLFWSVMEKYEWLREEAKKRALDEEELAFIREYAATKEWQMVFLEADQEFITQLFGGKDAKSAGSHQ